MSEEQEYTEAAEPEEAEAQEFEADGEEGEGEPPAPTWSDDDEAEARFYGWKPASEWRGDLPESYVHDPREFVENSHVAKKVRQKEAEKEAEYRKRFDKLERMTSTILGKTKSQYEQQLADIRAQQRAAVDEADGDRYDTLARKAETLTKEMEGFDEEPEPEEGTDPDATAHTAAVERYAAKHSSWFKKDPIMTDAAVAAYGQAMKEGISDPDARLEYVETKMAEYFPQKFGQQKPQRRQSAAVGDGLGLGAPRNKTGFDALPKEAKDQFKAFVGQGIYSDSAEDKAHYTEQYNAA